MIMENLEEILYKILIFNTILLENTSLKKGKYKQKLR